LLAFGECALLTASGRVTEYTCFSPYFRKTSLKQELMHTIKKIVTINVLHSGLWPLVARTRQRRANEIITFSGLPSTFGQKIAARARRQTKCVFGLFSLKQAKTREATVCCGALSG